eukprot:jgi/Ulvmu1/10305/UM060_0107.1
MFGKLRSGSMAKRQESLIARLFRFRGLTIIVAAPLVLIVLYLLLFPRPFASGDTEATGQQYAVVFDAGSTGSRVHVFKFATTRSGLVLLSDTFEQLKPGLSDSGWASEPKRSAASLKPLLDKAIAAVPVSHRASTPVEVRATAGLRLLPGSTSDHILEEVEKLLAASPFMAISDGVSIMEGVDEGAYSWLTLNYLLDNTGKPMEELVGAIDLGGGSVQQAFAVSDKVASSAPTGYVRKMAGGGKTYNVYVYSYLGFGLMQGRAAVLATDGSATCMNEGASGAFKSPTGEEFPLTSAPSGGDAERCGDAVRSALRLREDCGAKKELCTFAGAWGAVPSHSGRKFCVMSYFFDRALDAGIITDADATQAEVRPQAFADAAGRACALDAAAAESEFAGAGDNAPYMCLDLSFQAALLTDGMKVPADQKVTLVRQVKYRGEYYEAAWALGAAINTLSAIG